MRVAFIPWIALSAVVLGSGEVSLPSDAVETITRDISLAEHAQAESLESMSGAITLRRDSHVTGNVETDSGAVRVEGAYVGGRIETTSGDIYIGPDSRVDGGILVDRRGLIGVSLGDFRLGIPVGRDTPPRVVIGAQATVAGVLRFKRKVELLVSESATIGPVEGTTPVTFATEQPSN
jgi:cytoskeletal protein CcmA (bactofilin family)